MTIHFDEPLLVVIKHRQVNSLGTDSMQRRPMNTGLLDSPDAVSYTHLDVYKRQELASAGAC